MSQTTIMIAPADNPKAQQVLEAAGRVFMEQGYGAASMDAIAREAGVSKATLYAHFASKDQLFAAMIGVECRRHSEALSLPDIETQDVRQALRRFGREFLGIVLSPAGMAIHRIVIAEAPRFPELGRAFYEAGPRLVLDRLAAYFRRATERGVLKIDDPALAASQFIGMLRSTLFLRRALGIAAAGDEDDPERVLDAAITVLLEAYAVRMPR